MHSGSTAAAEHSSSSAAAYSSSYSMSYSTCLSPGTQICYTNSDTLESYPDLATSPRLTQKTSSCRDPSAPSCKSAAASEKTLATAAPAHASLTPTPSSPLPPPIAASPSPPAKTNKPNQTSTVASIPDTHLFCDWIALCDRSKPTLWADTDPDIQPVSLFPDRQSRQHSLVPSIRPGARGAALHDEVHCLLYVSFHVC